MVAIITVLTVIKILIIPAIATDLTEKHRFEIAERDLKKNHFYLFNFFILSRFVSSVVRSVIWK